MPFEQACGHSQLFPAHLQEEADLRGQGAAAEEGHILLERPRIERRNREKRAPDLLDTARQVRPVEHVRHGVDRDGHPLVEMPSNSYYYIGDVDLAAIIAYLKSLPPVDNELPERDLGLLYQLAILSDPSLIPAEVIDHTGPRPPAPEPGVNAEYGKYLATACTICHGPDLSGGSAAGAGLDLTGGGNLPDWTEAEFIHALRTGERPRGEDIDPNRMPWKRVGKLTDDELRAIWLYLQTLQ